MFDDVTRRANLWGMRTHNRYWLQASGMAICSLSKISYLTISFSSVFRESCTQLFDLRRGYIPVSTINFRVRTVARHSRIQTMLQPYTVSFSAFRKYYVRNSFEWPVECAGGTR